MCLSGSLRGIKKKRTTPKAPKEEKVMGKKKNPEKFPFAAKKNKTSKEAPASASFLSDGTSSLLPKRVFISDLQLTHNVVYPISKSENVKNARTKEPAGRCSKINVLDEKAKGDNDDSNLITGYKYVTYLLQGHCLGRGGKLVSI